MMTMSRRGGIAGSLLLLVSAMGIACGDDPGVTPHDASLPDSATADAFVADAPLPDATIPDAAPPDAPLADASPDPEGSFHHFVGNTLIVPSTSTQTRELALDIDGDANHRPDNAMGGIMAALRQQNVDVQAAVSAAVAAGKLVMLHSLQATDLTQAANAGWRIHLGLPTASPPHFDGSDSFELDPAGPGDDLIGGKIVAGQFDGGPGTATLLLTLGSGPPLRLHLVAARLHAKVAASGCSEGVLGGAITIAERDTQLIPGFTLMFNAAINDDGPDGAHPVACPTDGSACPAALNGDATTCDTTRNKCFSSTSKTILNLLDTDHDSQVTNQEMSDNPLIRALLAPDLDLFDASGQLHPNTDGERDSLSLGMGLSCVPASFTVPTE